MTENQKNNKRYFTEIFITQSICALIIIIIIFATKLFLKNEYKKIKTFYEKYICAQTSVEEVISTANNNLEQTENLRCCYEF